MSLQSSSFVSLSVISPVPTGRNSDSLLIDLNAEITMTILAGAGMEVDRAADGIQCIDMLEKAEPGYYDLILMDIQMPNMDGYKATMIDRIHLAEMRRQQSSREEI